MAELNVPALITALSFADGAIKNDDAWEALIAEVRVKHPEEVPENTQEFRTTIHGLIHEAISQVESILSETPELPAADNAYYSGQYI
jgi:hypothetical protein